MHSPFLFLIFVMRTLFFAVLILGIFRTPLNSSRIHSQVLQLLFGHASPLFDKSQDFLHQTWSVICAPRCSSGLRSGCSSPSGRCFGSRSPARRSRPLLQPVLVMISCASSSPPVLTSGCGRVLSRSPHFFSSSLPRDVDVHPSGRLCSR